MSDCVHDWKETHWPTGSLVIEKRCTKCGTLNVVAPSNVMALALAACGIDAKEKTLKTTVNCAYPEAPCTCGGAHGMG